MEQKKLIYWRIYNQYYRPIEIDEKHKICKMIVAKNKKDKSVTRDMIANVELYTDWKFVIYKNEFKTAEQNFLDVMRVPGHYNQKLNELTDFKRNGLVDSAKAMEEISYIFQKGFNDCISDNDRHFRQRVKALYTEILTEQTRKDNQRTYDQTIPAEIVKLAKSKRLFVERVDDYTIKNGRRAKTNKAEKQKIRERKTCGYLIRNEKGKTIVGNGYTLTSANVVEFVQKFSPYDDMSRQLPHTIRDKKTKQKQLSLFWRMLHSENVEDRQAAAKKSFADKIAEREIVIDILRRMVIDDSDFKVRKTIMETLHSYNAVDEELLKQYKKINNSVPKTSQFNHLKAMDKDERFVGYTKILNSLTGRKKSKHQRGLEKRELTCGVDLEIIKKLKQLNPNACIVNCGGRNGKYQIAGYNGICENFSKEEDILNWLNKMKKERN